MDGKKNLGELCGMLSTIVDSISDGVFAVDTHKKIIFFNKSAERITGFSTAEAIGQNCYDIFQTDFCETNCALQHTLATGETAINKPICIRNKKERRIPISVSTALLRDAKGNIVGAVETFRDLDLVRRMQREYEAQYTFENMISRNQKMLDIFQLLPTIAESESTVLIEGESGTGKELVARALQSLSPRKKKPFISINCGALPDTLLESELFGYVAGAFTDAKKDKKGRFALAEGGTLFLDEIGEISPAMQVKLLRVLQEKSFEPLGATKSIKTDVRVLAATNRRLEDLVADGRFRKDLYYRINVIKISLPPLRERREDIQMLAEHFIEQFNRLRHKNISGISPRALKLLMGHDFPGNIRELENIVEHACVLSPGGIIKPEDLPDSLQENKPIPVVEIAGSMEEMESLFIMAALKRNNWSRKKTSAELGINPSTLYRKIKKLGLQIPSPKTEHN